MKRRLIQRLAGSRETAAMVAGFVLLVLAGLAAAAAALASADAAAWSVHSAEVRQAEARLFRLVQEAETGQRGYLLTGDPSYLDPFTTARRELPAAEAELRALTGDNAAQQARLDQLRPIIDEKVDELARTIGRMQAGDQAGALAIVRTNKGRDLMRRFRSISVEFDRAEVELQATRTDRAAFRRSILAAVILIALLLAAALAWLVIRTDRRRTHELRSANDALRREISQRQQAEGQLRQAQKMEALGQLTGGVAHDFNNMLAIIVGNLDLLTRRLISDDERVRAMIENALGGARRAAELTKRLLAFSRLQPLQPQPTDVNRCVCEMSEMLRRSLGEGIAVETVLGGGLWPALVDRPQLESAILNLAVNARDAMAGQGHLTIETANAMLDQAYADAHVEVTPGQYVAVSITDTGAGMDQGVLAKAFDPFFTTKGVGQGTGLGLSQVHGFAKQSNGHVKLYSEPGVGTTVKIYLPRSQAVPALVQATPARLSSDLAERKVLVVEDEAGVRSFALSALRELGCWAIGADGAEMARRTLAEQPGIEILLTDVVMPGENGRALVDSIRGTHPDLIVLFMTGYTRNAIVHNGMLDPGVRLLSKPFTVADLARELQAALEEKQRGQLSSSNMTSGKKAGSS
ncbi:CHASE3 domain-containing protein [Methylobacterium sp. J-070]|uniref:CHASE3 domain-containing protein n=1 Tax=Methylobacterium sp. J-070 TaxID=2836650 RepID=UPI001FBB03B5|nr:CHASE3 domain-containing protein [Methylobacterium sp. J-070]MCJ2051789.1 CHASE3 domain-containing protein [Methylobacterium sp. J-070]